MAAFDPAVAGQKGGHCYLLTYLPDLLIL